MKKGKSCDEDGISAEHLHNAPLIVLKRLTNLFNQMLKHSFVPEQFRFGFMVPIVKNHQASHGDASNYRGITISPITSKLFEHALKFVFGGYLGTSDCQFGFKKNHSTVHALHCLRETVDYFVNNGSRVYSTFLDASKAFDRIIHSGLFIKLMERNVPIMFLNVIVSWYDGLQCRVKWGNHLSAWFAISAGVRQGGILSPDFYSIYVDAMVSFWNWKTLKLLLGHSVCSGIVLRWWYGDSGSFSQRLTVVTQGVWRLLPEMGHLPKCEQVKESLFRQKDINYSQSGIE